MPRFELSAGGSCSFSGWAEGFRCLRRGRVVTGNSKAGSVARGVWGTYNFYGDAAEVLQCRALEAPFEPTSDSRALFLRPPRSARGGGRLGPVRSAGTRPGFPAAAQARARARISIPELTAGAHACTLLELAAGVVRFKPHTPARRLIPRYGYLRKSVANAAETGFRWYSHSTKGRPTARPTAWPMK